MKMDFATINAIFLQAQEVKFYEWDLPIGLSLQLSRIVGELAKENKYFDDERIKLLKKYAELDENNELKTDEKGNAIISQEDRLKFNEDLQELIKEEIDINIQPLKLDFDKLEAKGINKKPNEVAWIVPLLAEENNEENNEKK